MGFWRRKARAGESRAELAGRLAALIDLVDEGIRAQPNAEEAIAECCRAGAPPADVARRGGRIVSEYARLHQAAVDLGCEPGSLRERVAELLLYHATTVEDCLKLAFSKFWSPNAPRHGHSHSGLGEHARTLRECRVALQMWLDDVRSG
ncbi:hypothetical protein LWC34_01740 [Kibdelosporangium philippinense]|uniref:Uncharacterized protein n=1 Tax=Kibdelosporangium philippinense TaxID=211113 RepID=A0ABS8Z3R0_9PSEU|nr:hypothetical protein [Kibdelosporangium philippinense]MCE7001569.1 hypothetical protein [Kibdelosporangium philippinense]